MAQVTDNLKKIRIEKLDKLRQESIDPYPSVVKRENSIKEAIEREEGKISVAGRVLAKRGHGKIIFFNLKDESGSIQVVFKADFLDEKKFRLLEFIDIADFLAVQGNVGKTQSGEISVFASDFQVITKALLPLPDQWYGLKDIEERYRKRYLDLILNPPVQDKLIARGKIIQAIRQYLIEREFIEVETPTLQPIYGGGFAKPFKTHHNALDADLYLRISDEMYLKRLVVGGFEKVFEITKVFRNEGVDIDHNPEFTMFEAMIAYADYTYGMELIEQIIEFAAVSIFGKTKFAFQEMEIDFTRPWRRLRVVEAIREYTGLDPLTWSSVEEAKKSARTIKTDESKFKVLNRMERIGEVVAFVFEEAVEEKLLQPTITYDYPIEVSPLAKKCEDPRFTQRFEMFAAGIELGNNYTELNDPLDLYTRFVEEKKREQAGFEEAHQTDYDYLTAIEHGFPPTCGVAIGIDRLVMLMVNGKNIKEVIAFPLLRPEKQEQPKRSKQDFGQKMVIVIDRSLPGWQIMNTSAHAAAFLGNKMQAEFDTGKYFVTKDGFNHPRNSQYAIVTLSATPPDLKKLMDEVRDSGLLFIGYVPEMMQTSDDQELEKLLAAKNDDEVKLTGIGIFGPTNKVDALTKKFPLWE